MTGAPPSIAVQRSAPAASARPIACDTSSVLPVAPVAPVVRRFEAAHTALVVAECTVWKRPPSMRSRSTRWPPASTIATVIATPASCARASAVAMIFFAPAPVRRRPWATYMSSSSRYILAGMPLSHIEHLLIASDDIDATRDWYARVLGMTSGPHPDFGFPVHWMYLGGVDVVHIGPSAKN